MSVSLVRPTLDMKNEYMEFVEEWRKSGEEITPYSARLINRDYSQWVEDTIKLQNIDSGTDELVSAHTYFLINDSRKIIGAVNIRHYLNRYLFKFGGHIGYGIIPSERKKGYASKMLELAIPIAKELKIEKILITCDKDNIASAKTIMKNGGLLENEVEEEDGNIVQRYWIY